MTVPGPLAGTTVIELGTAITAPYVALLLADLGAEVIKVESPAGDPFRIWDGTGPSPRFLAFNRNKQSVVLDLRSEGGRADLAALIATADVFVSNFRPAALARLGADAGTVTALNPAIIYCEITGAGPGVERPMYDAVAQGLCGLMSMTSGTSDPRPRGPALSDSITGALCAVAVSAALVERARTGKGQLIRSSMLQACLSFLAESVTSFQAAGASPDPFTRPHHSQSYGFSCQDGRAVVVHLSTPAKFWDALLQVTDRPDLADDPRFVDYGARVEHYDALVAELAPVFVTAPSSVWLERLGQADVPAAPINTLAEALTDPLIAPLGVTPTIDVDGEAIPAVGRPWHLADPPPYAAPPRLGQHTEAVLDAVRERADG